MSRPRAGVVLGSKDGGGHDYGDGDGDGDGDMSMLIAFLLLDWSPHRKRCAVPQQPGHVPQVEEVLSSCNSRSSSTRSESDRDNFGVDDE